MWLTYPRYRGAARVLWPVWRDRVGEREDGPQHGPVARLRLPRLLQHGRHREGENVVTGNLEQVKLNKGGGIDVIGGCRFWAQMTTAVDAP